LRTERLAAQERGKLRSLAFVLGRMDSHGQLRGREPIVPGMKSLLSNANPGMSAARTCLLLSIAVALAIAALPQLCAQKTSDKEQIRKLAEQAQAALQNHQLDLAIEEYKKVLALDPDNAGAHANLGVAYYMNGSFSQAIEHFRVAIGRQHDLWKIVALLGMSEKQLGQNVQAESHLKEAFAHVQDKDLHAAVGKQMFTLYIQAGKLIEAANVAGQLQEENPSDVDILYAAHLVYSELANSTLYSMAVLEPDSARMYQSKGDELAQQGNTAGAIAALRQALNRDPHLPGAHYELAEILSASTSAAERAQAEGEYQLALSDNPLDEKAECGLGAIALQRSDFQAASGHYAEAVRLQPDDPAANEGLGVALVSLEELKKARPYLERAVQMDPENARARYHLSQLDGKLGDVPAAKREMQEFLRLKAEQERIVQVLKDMHGQLLTQIQKDRDIDASTDTTPN